MYGQNNPQSIVHSQFRSMSAFATFLDADLVTLAHILSMSPLFVSFAIFSTASEVKKKVLFLLEILQF